MAIVSSRDSQAERLPLIGRARELQWIAERLRADGVAWVHGPIGIGVSALLAEVEAAWPGPTRAVDLTGAADAGLQARLGHRHVGKRIRRDTDPSSELMANLVLGPTGLLLLDHADEVLDETAALLRAARTARVRVLVGANASPEPGGPAGLALEGLLPEQAWQVFVGMARRAQREVDEGAPELAAMQVLRGNPGLLLASTAWLGRLSIADAARLYTGDPMRFDEGPSGRSPTLWPALHARWRSLSALEQQRLYACSSFEEGFDVSTTDVVGAGEDPSAVLTVLARLRRFGWLQPHPLARTRVQVEPTALVFVRDQLARSGRRAAIYADHAVWAAAAALRLERAARTGDDQAVDALRAEAANLAAVAERRGNATRRGAEQPVATQLALETLARLDGDAEARARALEAAEEHAAAAGAAEQARVARRRAKWCLDRGALADARDALTPWGFDSPVGVRLLTLLGEGERAEAALVAALAVADSQEGVGIVQIEAARLAWAKGDAAGAAQAGSTARALLGERDPRVAAADAIALEGVLAELDLNRAASLVTSNAELRPSSVSTLILRARLALAMRDEAATEYLAVAGRHAPADDPWHAVRAALYRAQSAQDRLAFGAATLAYEAAWDVADYLHAPGVRAEVGLWRGLLAYEQGSLVLAGEWLEVAITDAKLAGNERLEGLAALARAIVAVDLRAVAVRWFEQGDGALLLCPDAEADEVRGLVHAHAAAAADPVRARRAVERAIAGPSTSSLLVRSFARLLARALTARRSTDR